MTDFLAFWAAYPRRVGKLDAEKAYEKARRRASADEILAGVEIYKRNKPEYADWAHPSTWLNKGRWMDEYEEPVVAKADDGWYDECQALHGGTCGGQFRHSQQKRIDAQKKASA